MNSFEQGSAVFVCNKMQANYQFVLTAPRGAEYAQGFTPKFTPGEMLRLGVFEGKYMTDCSLEYPPEMFAQARMSPEKPNPTGINAFKAKSRNPLTFWKQSGWIYESDPRGWFEWYCRYWLGRRCSDDARQIGRWYRFAPRHAGALLSAGYGNVSIRKATRQALLQWSHDPVPDIVANTLETVSEKTHRILGKKIYDPIRTA